MATEKKKVKKAPQSFEGEPTLAEKLHFERISREVSAMPWHTMSHSPTADESAPLIGTLREKRLHAVIKRYLCEDVTTHEIPLRDIVSKDGASVNTKMVADVLVGDHIYEVQTGGFYPLKKKLQWYLDHTACNITVVHPMAGSKYLSWIDPDNGQVVSRTRNNRRGRVKDVAKELYWLKDFIDNPRFSLRLLLLEIEEYRILDGYGKEKKIRASKYERFPVSLLGDVRLYEPEDYAFYFLPESIGNEPFTAAEYAKASGIRGKAAYAMLHLMVTLGVLSEGEKLGRSMTFLRSR
ncbi:MAG: hypothetical protein IJW00_10945 [Clostridia bacterium]|nr:hypothetical protein [Clostridia bacterium]MBQ9781442.1 hypothetical protein [Clostridia bacterium]